MQFPVRIAFAHALAVGLTLTAALPVAAQDPAPPAPAGTEAEPARPYNPREARRERHREPVLIRGDRAGAESAAPSGRIADNGAADAPSGIATAGWIPLHDVIRFIEAGTGQSVLYPSATRDPSFSSEVRIEVLTDIDPFTVDVAIALLVANHYSIVGTRLPDGTPVLSLAALRSRTGPPEVLPAPSLVFAGGEALPEGNDLALATCVRDLEHVDAAVAAQVLREYLSIAGSSTGHTGVIPVPATGQIILTASVGRLRTILALLERIDVPARGSATPAEGGSEGD